MLYYNMQGFDNVLRRLLMGLSDMLACTAAPACYNMCCRRGTVCIGNNVELSTW